MIENLDNFIRYFTSEQNRERKRKAYADYEVFKGLQRNYVINRLKDIYPDNYKTFRIADISIAKKVTEKKSRAYSQQPKRMVSSGQEVLDSIYSSTNFLQAFKDFDLLYNYYRYGCVWVRHFPSATPGEMGNYVLRSLKPFEFDIIFDEDGEPKIFAICYEKPQNYTEGMFKDISSIYSQYSYTFKQDLGNCIYVVWSKDEINTVTGGQQGFGQILKEEPNELGILPCAYLQYETKPEYPLPQILANQCIDWNVAFSDLKTAASVQGHGQLVLSYPINTEKTPKIKLGMYQALALPQLHPDQGAKTEAGFINPQPDLNGQLEVLKFDLMQILEDHGLRGRKSVSTSNVEQFSSGFDRLISESDVQYIIDNNQSLYSDKLEQDVFKIIKQYETKMNRMDFASVERLDVKFERPKVLISDRETLENLSMRVNLGLVTSWEKHKYIDPNLTDDEAKEREKMIEKDIKEQQSKGLLPKPEPGMEGMASKNMRPKQSDSDKPNGQNK